MFRRVFWREFLFMIRRHPNETYGTEILLWIVRVALVGFLICFSLVIFELVGAYFGFRPPIVP